VGGCASGGRLGISARHGVRGPRSPIVPPVADNHLALGDRLAQISAAAPRGRQSVGRDYTMPVAVGTPFSVLREGIHALLRSTIFK
jgi:hypothetical protein